MKSIALVCSLLMPAVAAQAQDIVPTSTTEGVFTEAQAKKGEQAYQSHCAGCHGLDLNRTEPEAPDLTGGPFQYGWQGKTIGERFEKIRATMPKASPRSLDDQTYLDIVAYILRYNGIPAGARSLAANPGALEKIVIAIPTATAGGGRRKR